MLFLPKSKHFLIAITEQTAGGIIVPDTAKHLVESFEKEPQLVVCAAQDSNFKVGDYVMLEPHQMRTVFVDNLKYFIVPDYLVYGTVLNYTPKAKPSKIILND